MAAKSLMKMNVAQMRWYGKFKGRQLAVGYRTLAKEFPELVTGRSESGMRAAANAWWERETSTIEKQQPIDPLQTIREIVDGKLRTLLDHAKLVSDKRGIKVWSAVRQKLPSMSIDQLHTAVTELADADDIIEDRAATLAAIKRPAEAKLAFAAQLESFMGRKKTQVEAGERSAGRYDGLRHHLNVFQAFFGEDTTVTTINSQTLLDFHTHLLDQIKANKFGRDYAAACMRDTKQFIRHLWSLELCQLPRNIDAKDLKISIPQRTIKTTDAKVIHAMMVGTPDRTKLYLMLMLNCGMTQQDIADLKPSEIDWKRKRITRQRSKTAGNENVPTVSYPLWPETFRLLKICATKSGDLALPNTSGGSLKTTEIQDDGTVKKIDNIRTAYARLCKRLAIKKPPALKIFRKTASSMLDNHPEFGRFAPYFLGHSAKSISAKHYVTPSEEQFDAAVAWLGQQFKF